VSLFVVCASQESICADAASFDLPASHLASCIQEARYGHVRTAPPPRLINRLWQANACWEALASQEEPLPDEPRFGAGLAAGDSKHCADDFKQLKVLLRLLEERISKETPSVRSCCSIFLARRAHLLTFSLQGGAGVTHPAQFLFGLLADLGITAVTAPLLIVRALSSVKPTAGASAMHLTPPAHRVLAQDVMDAASEQLAGDAAAAGSKTVSPLLRLSHRAMEMTRIAMSCHRLVAHRTIA
jgi:hypothetical protein